MPIDEIGEIAATHHTLLLVDATQTAGHVPIDVSRSKIDLLALTGHKGLLGPMGTGALYVRQGVAIRPLLTGGTGFRSDSLDPPTMMPHTIEVGTLNGVGIAGLLGGLLYVQGRGIATIEREERELTAYALNALTDIDHLTIHGPRTATGRVGVISVTHAEFSPAELGYCLDTSFRIMCRVGLHCAPLIHSYIGCEPNGTVRISIGPFSSLADIDALSAALRKINTPQFQDAIVVSA